MWVVSHTTAFDTSRRARRQNHARAARSRFCDSRPELTAASLPVISLIAMTKILRRHRALILALSGLGLAQPRCGSSPTDFFAGTAGISAAGKNAAGAAHANAGSAGSVGGSGGTGDEAGAGGVAVSSEFVFDSQVLPTSSSSYALDLDGDAKPENAYGRVLSALSAYGLPAQAAADTELAAGRGLQLLAVEVPSNSASGSATLELWRAEDQANPDFGGTGSFVVDSLAPSARLGAIIMGDELNSVQAAVGETLPRLLLHLPLGGAVDLPVSVYSISFQITADGLTRG